MNVGATSETDYGNYYKYGSGATAGSTDDTYYWGNESPLSSSRDTAVQVWGGQWHMPTQTQCGELIDTTYTYCVWISINGVYGVKITSKTDTSKYIFLPAAGLCANGASYNVGSDCYYWTSTPIGMSENACYLYSGSDSGGEPNISSFNRMFGCPVRPVIG